MGQDPSAEGLLSQSDLRLVLPSVCIMESISAFDWKRIERNRLKNELEAQTTQVIRSTAIHTAQQLASELIHAKLTNDKLLDELYKRLDDCLLRLAPRAELLALTANIVEHA